MVLSTASRVLNANINYIFKLNSGTESMQIHPSAKPPTTWLNLKIWTHIDTDRHTFTNTHMEPDGAEGQLIHPVWDECKACAL